MTAKDIKHQLLLRKWADIVRERMQSGLTVEEFCAHNQLSSKSYYRWQKLVRESVMPSGPAAGVSETSPVFASLCPSPTEPPSLARNHPETESGLTIQWRSFSITVTSRTPPDVLRRTLAILQEL